MSAHRLLADLLQAPYELSDPGDTGTIRVDRQFTYVPLVSAGAETRTLAVPAKAGLYVTLAMKTYVGAVTVTVTSGYNEAAATSLVFNTAGDMVILHSVCTAADTYRWRVVSYKGVAVTEDVHSITAMSATSAVLGSASVASILATNISIGTGLTAPNIVATSAMSLNSGLLTNLSVGTGATIPNIVATSAMSLNSLLGTNASVSNLSVKAGLNLSIPALLVSGYSVASSASAPALTGLVNLISVSAANSNYFKLPTVARGLCVNVVNVGASTAGLIGYSGAESIGGATSVQLATMNAESSALDLVCDGTSWWNRNM